MMAYQASGIMPKQLAEAPELPSLASHVWVWFCELHEARGGGGMGVSPISYRDIQDWSELTRTRIEPWEIRAIRKVDCAFIQSAAEQTEHKK
jgi:hypothetical protein